MLYYLYYCQIAHDNSSDVLNPWLWSRLAPGGTVQVATDHLDYFTEIRKRLANDRRFREVPHLVRDAAEQTDFELIFRGQGLPIGECAFEAALAIGGNQQAMDLGPHLVG